MLRLRPVLRKVLLVLFGILLPLSLLAGWANTTLYDSQTFSERSVDLLNSPAVRRELASRITEQLARDGNQQAVNFRPAYQLAIEAVIDTDTFRSIFRTAVKRTHQGLIQNPGMEAGTGLDLSDSVAIIGSTLSLPQDAKPSETPSGSLGTSLTDVTDRVGRLGLWKLNDLSAGLFLFGGVAAVVCAAGSIALADDKRRSIKHLGIVIVVAGLFLFVLVAAAGWIAGSRIGNPQLASAVQGAIARGMADLTSIGLWTAGYGLVLMAAAGAMAEDAKRITPASTVRWVGGWVERRRASTRGTIGLGAVAIFAGLLLIMDPSFWLRAAVVGAGMWLVYFGITEMLRLLRSSTVVAEAGTPHQARVRRYVALGAMAVVLIAALTVGGVAATRRAAAKSEQAGQLLCNGEASLCDLPLNFAVFPGTHNSMSTALYPGWLFAEQIDTIGGQLNSGIRALLIDTHYGVPSSAVLPGSETPIVLTDRAAELEQPVGEDIDPAVAAKAQQLAANAPPIANATREIYLCHNFCELGAVKFSSVLGEIKKFVDTHPDDVVMTIIQDATTPADTAAAIEKAGLADKIWTLNPDEPLPTLGEMIEAGKTLLVFAEEGGGGAPPWYQKAYDWFQETRYKWASTEEMTCAPNRGTSDAPLFLVNHWVGASPPNPSSAKRANSAEELTKRLERCAEERGLLPNIVAADFAEKGDVVKVARDLNQVLLDEIKDLKNQARGVVTGTPGTDADGGGGTLPAGGSGDASTFGVATTYAQLTGGDPVAFCAVAAPVSSAGASWALASGFASGDQQGLADLAFASLAARALDAAITVAPDEIAARLALPRDRAHRAVEALQGLGLTDSQIAELADLAVSTQNDPSTADPIQVQAVVVDRLGQLTSPDRVLAAGRTFYRDNPQPEGLFDFGVVTDAVARASGYDCLAP